MITKLRWFIPSFLVLALLGLLATVPALAAPAGADGTIALSGGYSTGKFYSGIAGFNIATATVTDTDLSSQRTGTIRVTDETAVAAFTMSHVDSILEGEVSKTETYTATANQTVFNLTEIPRDANADGVLHATNTTDVTATKNGAAYTSITVNYTATPATVTLGAGAAPL